MTEIRTETVVYARSGVENLELELFHPAVGRPKAILLDIHGGAWTFFDRRVDWYWCRGLAERGYLVASADFRQAPVHPWPACLSDLRAAARWVLAHRQTLAAADCRFGVIGGSTGGHLAAMLSLCPDDGEDPHTEAVDTPEGQEVAVDFAIPLWPILDVPGRYRMVTGARFDPLASYLADRAIRRGGGRPSTDDTVERMRRLDELRRRSPKVGDLVSEGVQWLTAAGGRFPPAKAILFRTLAAAHEGAFQGIAEMERASPLHLVDHVALPKPPPMLIVQGDADRNMTVAMTQQFVDRYRARGGSVEFDVLSGLGHSFGNIPSAAADGLIERIDRFVTKAVAA